MMPVTIGIGVEPANLTLQIAHRRVGGQFEQVILNADRGAGFALPLRVQLAGRRRADEDRREMDALAARGEFRDAPGDVGSLSVGRSRSRRSTGP